ncbi:MAG: hypothetical protein L0216_04310 [Planctomycetales bacterium]|nr:hypothetical protein [Planctomycetales bacterium]
MRDLGPVYRAALGVPGASEAPDAAPARAAEVPAAIARVAALLERAAGRPVALVGPVPPPALEKAARALGRGLARASVRGALAVLAGPPDRSAAAGLAGALLAVVPGRTGTREAAECADALRAAGVAVLGTLGVEA